MPRAPKTIIRKGHVPSLAKLAGKLEVSIPTATNYKHAGMPVEKDGTYNVEKCRKWVIEYRERKHERNMQAAHQRKMSKMTNALGGNGSPLPPEKADLITRKMKAETRKLQQEARGKKLKNDEYEGMLLPADDVRQWIATRFLRIKQRLELLPDELQMLAPASLRPQLRADLMSHIHELLLEMSSWEVIAAAKDTDFGEEASL